MSGIIYKAASGAILQQMRLDVYTNNLANINTSGFKADLPVFKLDPEETAAGTAPHAARLSPYAVPLEHATDFQSGAVQSTGNPLDVAITGPGFFEVQTPDGLQYTRNGHFTVNDNGMLSTTEGWPVMGEGGEIAIEGSRIEINAAGEIAVNGDAAGVLKVVDFADPAQLHKSGGTFFKPQDTFAEALDPTAYHITQGAVEGSNVNAIRTMTEIIETSRLFETYQKVIKAADETTAKTVSQVGQTA